MSGGDDEGEFEDAQLVHRSWLILAPARFLIQLNEFACKLHFSFDNDIIHGNNSE